jgi:hypothetical protein
MSGKFLSQLTRVAHLAYALAAALAAMAVWGWALDVQWLRDLGADFAPMSAPAAFAFLLLAAGFSSAERGRRFTALVASIMVALIAARRSPRRWRGCPSAWASRWSPASACCCLRWSRRCRATRGRLVFRCRESRLRG